MSQRNNVIVVAAIALIAVGVFGDKIELDSLNPGSVVEKREPLREPTGTLRDAVSELRDVAMDLPSDQKSFLSKAYTDFAKMLPKSKLTTTKDLKESLQEFDAIVFSDRGIRVNGYSAAIDKAFAANGWEKPKAATKNEMVDFVNALAWAVE